MKSLEEIRSKKEDLKKEYESFCSKYEEYMKSGIDFRDPKNIGELADFIHCMTKTISIKDQIGFIDFYILGESTSLESVVLPYITLGKKEERRTHESSIRKRTEG